jgi:hypothetical protein
MRLPSSGHQNEEPDKEPRLRHEFVGMMFAVAIGEVGLQTATLIQAHRWVHFLPAYCHLALATLIIATSWVGWTLSPSPGARRDVKRVLEWEFILLLLDVILVIFYFILVKSVDITEGPEIHLNASAAPESFWICVIFGAYLAWDILSKYVMQRGMKSSGSSSYSSDMLRIIPTLTCFILALVIKSLVEGADPPHVLAADFALISLVLFYRAAKDLMSALFPKPEVPGNLVRSRKYWSVAWSVLFGLGILFGILWTRLWPIPQSIAAEIQKAPSPKSSYSEITTPSK